MEDGEGWLQEAGRSVLPVLADKDIVTAISVTSEFIDSATALLTQIEQAIQREVRRLETHDEGSLTTLQKQMRTDLSALEQILVTLGEN